MQVDDALVDAHLKAVPGLGTLTAWRLTRGDAKNLGGEAYRARDATLKALLLCTLLEVSAHWKRRRAGRDAKNRDGGGWVRRCVRGRG